MTQRLIDPVEVRVLRPSDRDEFRNEVMAALQQQQKTLPCKLFYDDHGSNLFEQICAQKEYYPTRTELGIMRRHAREMARIIGTRSLFVEYGSGSSLKTRLLLEALSDCAGYIPIEISRAQLIATSKALSDAYPHIPIQPVHADYMRPIRLPLFDDNDEMPKFAYFPGSTIGNFERADALAFLRRIRETCGPRCGLLIGVDLKKDPILLHAAYNDAAGITAQFNLNALRHLNRELGTDFQLDAFRHYAFYQPGLSRMEMHLVSLRSQQVNFGSDRIVSFDEGESIHTESCHKYSVEDFTNLLATVGFNPMGIWTDPKKWFSVQYFLAED